ncbi:MAG: hypothetical protein AAF958_13385 [Planctomycetota bacterium]
MRSFRYHSLPSNTPVSGNPALSANPLHRQTRFIGKPGGMLSDY